MASTCNMGQLQLLKAKPKLSQHHSSTLPLSGVLGLDQVPAALSFSDCNMMAKKMPKISIHFHKGNHAHEYEGPGDVLPTQKSQEQNANS